jgi:MFS family permease
MLVPNVVGLMTGFGLFASFLGVTQFVEAPPAAGYGFDATTLEAAVVFLLPGGVLGVLLAPFAGSVVARIGGMRILLVGAAAGLGGFLVLATLPESRWPVVVSGMLTQLSTVIAFAALPALVVAAVRPAETGVANGVNSITRSFGSALASALTVTLIAGAIDPSTGLPRASAFVLVGVIGAASCLVIAAAAVLGSLADRRRGGEERLAGTAEPTACAGQWSPVSGIR